jgi:hypothetical protein
MGAIGMSQGLSPDNGAGSGHRDRPRPWPAPGEAQTSWADDGRWVRAPQVRGPVPVPSGRAEWLHPGRWRKTTWAINIWNALGLYLIVSVVTDDSAKACKGDQTCVGLTQIGEAFAVLVFLLIWLVVFLALLFTWFMTRPPRRVCPSCGGTVRPRPNCRKCGYDFNTGTSPVHS